MVQSRVYFFTYLVHVGVECQVFFKIDTQFYRRISSLFYIFIYFIEWFATIWWLASFWYDTGSDNCMSPTVVSSSPTSKWQIVKYALQESYQHTNILGKKEDNKKKQSNYRDILFQVGITKHALSKLLIHSELK